MKKNNIMCKVTGRAKYFYSIYKKMKEENKSFDEIYDLIGVRIITIKEEDCYNALSALHKEFHPVKDKFKDYIKEPKENGYQSIHASVYGPFNKILEIQIRTLQMHYDAESGPAAHWKYKGTERDKIFDKKINWLRELMAWLRESGKGSGLIEDLKIDLFENEIIVFTPKGDPVSLPEKATPIDFAYEVHTNLGQHATGCTVNGKSVSLGELLQSGDVVEIITSKNAEPNRNWLNFAITSKARGKIKNFLNVLSPSSKKLRMKQEAEENAPLSEAVLIKKIIIKGAKGQIKISGCCKPNYGDSICGYTLKEGIAIHKTNCPNARALDESKKILVDWKEDENANVKEIRIYCDDRIGLLAQVMNTASENNGIKVTAINTRPKKDKIEIILHLTINKKEDYDNFAMKARQIKGVIDVQKEEQ
jgi:(p)ppGpp synthase/HD superfamily hydrolase